MSKKKKPVAPDKNTPIDPLLSDSVTQPSLSKEGNGSFPIVGIGASAGGLEAFERFFANMPTDSGMAFVLVQHLSGPHKSILEDLVGRYTEMPVHVVKDGVKVEPDNIYIIPPSKDMALLHGTLHLMEPEKPRGLRLPIDYFFRSLAQDKREQAIGIILSGTGSDGTLGLRAISGAGGMIMVEEPESAKYDGMPRSAINTGLVDYILPPDKMPQQMLAFLKHTFERQYIEEVAPTAPDKTDTLQKIFVLLRAQIGHDFSYYKQNTIRRRIERRMTVNQIPQLPDYVRYLQHNPLEVDTLFRELLIGVTNFFRDPEAFAALEEKVIPQLLASKSPPEQPIRVWVPGCSTGEEAYSLAILFQEQMKAQKRPFTVQIFATDIDHEAIEKARIGAYPDGIVADVSPERLKRFFTQENSSYHIKKSVRDMVVFATQNVIADPPFSRLDLISCRNLLIYLGPNLQKKALPLFHYALNQDKFLFLGNSETVGEFNDLFGVVDRKWKLFQRQGIVAPRRLPVDFATPGARAGSSFDQMVKEGKAETRMSVRELTERKLLEGYTPTTILINEKCDILYIHGRSGHFLEPAPGEADNNILKMARRGLRMELTTAIRKAIAQKQAVHCRELPVKTNGGSQPVNLTVEPVLDPPSMQGLLLVLLEILPTESVATAVDEPVSDKDGLITKLERELRAKEEYLQTTIEELETSNEELKSTNEELQSSNEELQSTNEEMETSKEELQSINEELVTVNAELQQKNIALSRANNDMNNLMASTQIGTLFLDFDLCVQRFTPAATQLINLIPSDIGRPINHIVSNLKSDHLVEDAQRVLDDLIPREIEVEADDGRWYWMRIMPYRTVENVIEGVVITFADISEQKRVQTALRESEGKYRSLAENSPDTISIVDQAGLIQFVNRTAGEFKIEDVMGKMTIYDFQPPESHADHKKRLAQLFETGLPTTFEISRTNAQNITSWYETRLVPVTRAGEVTAAMLIATDITEQKEAAELRRLAVVVRDSNDAIMVQDFAGQILAWNLGAERLYGWKEAEALAMNARDIVPKEKHEETLAFIKKLAQGELIESFQTQRVCRNGRVLSIWLTAITLIDSNNQPYAIATTERDVTEWER